MLRILNVLRISQAGSVQLRCLSDEKGEHNAIVGYAIADDSSVVFTTLYCYVQRPSSTKHGNLKKNLPKMKVLRLQGVIMKIFGWKRGKLDSTVA